VKKNWSNRLEFLKNQTELKPKKTEPNRKQPSQTEKQKKLSQTKTGRFEPIFVFFKKSNLFIYYYYYFFIKTIETFLPLPSPNWYKKGVRGRYKLPGKREIRKGQL